MPLSHPDLLAPGAARGIAMLSKQLFTPAKSVLNQRWQGSMCSKTSSITCIQYGVLQLQRHIIQAMHGLQLCRANIQQKKPLSPTATHKVQARKPPCSQWAADAASHTTLSALLHISLELQPQHAKCADKSRTSLCLPSCKAARQAFAMSLGH
jgi:hypothetical protein